MLKMLILDFEVFLKDWFLVAYDPDLTIVYKIHNDKRQLESLYNYYQEHLIIWHNGENYDKYIYNAILLDIDPYLISNKIINNILSYQDRTLLSTFTFYSYDTINSSTVKNTGLKVLEAHMGDSIEESTIDFNLNRELTQDEIDETFKYCEHDVKETYKVFMNVQDDYNNTLSLIDMYHLDRNLCLHLTNTSIASVILHAQRKNDLEYKLTIPDTIKLDKYKWVYDEIVNNYKSNDNFSLEFNVDDNLKFILKDGGAHGGLENYFSEGIILNLDVSAFYPSMIIEYDLLSRCVPEEYKRLYPEARDLRLKFKREKNSRHQGLKVFLNSVYGASRMENGKLYDPAMGDSICMTGQLLLLDLIEKIEDKCKIININTDGLVVQTWSYDRIREIKKECEDWMQRSRMNLEFENWVQIWQKDVNNYIALKEDGSIKFKGGQVSQPTTFNNSHDIIKRGIANYFLNGIKPHEWLQEEHPLIMFQKVNKLSKASYDFFGYIDRGELKRVPNTVIRTFNSLEPESYQYYSVNKKEMVKLSDTSKHSIIYNKDINSYTSKNVPFNLDLDFYEYLLNSKLTLWRGAKNKIKKNDKKKYELIRKENQCSIDSW